MYKEPTLCVNDKIINNSKKLKMGLQKIPPYWSKENLGETISKARLFHAPTRTTSSGCLMLISEAIRDMEQTESVFLNS